MDLEKPFKLAQTLTKDYALYVVEFFGVKLPDATETSEAPKRPYLNDANFWAFFLLGSFFTQLILHVSFRKQIEIFPGVISGALFAAWKWTLFALIAHLLLKAFRGKASLFATISVCLLGLSVVSLIASLLTLTSVLLLRSIGTDLQYVLVTVVLYLFFKMIIASPYLTRKLVLEHAMVGRVVIPLYLSIPISLFLVEFFISPFLSVYLSIFSSLR